MPPSVRIHRHFIWIARCAPPRMARNIIISFISQLKYFYAATVFSSLQLMYLFLKVQKHFSLYGGSRHNFASFHSSYWLTFDSHSTGCSKPLLLSHYLWHTNIKCCCFGRRANPLEQFQLLVMIHLPAKLVSPLLSEITLTQRTCPHAVLSWHHR